MTSVPFITRSPTENETERLKLAFSTFRDGSGMIMQSDTTTLPGWRDFERAVAAVLGGKAPEGKQVFDVFVPSPDDPQVDFGLSIKSKELSRVAAIRDLDSTGRVYMELANSPAKFWDALEREGIKKEYFGRDDFVQRIGEVVLATVASWHSEAEALHSGFPTRRKLDLSRSVYLTVSYSKPRTGQPREYQLHAFDMKFPQRISWGYRRRNGENPKSIVGMDPEHPDEVLFDWYPFSGGQLKYYPRAAYARYATPRFELAQPSMVPITAKAARYWPSEWISSGGSLDLAIDDVANELEAINSVLNDQNAKEIICSTIKSLRDL